MCALYWASSQREGSHQIATSAAGMARQLVTGRRSGNFARRRSYMNKAYTAAYVHPIYARAFNSGDIESTVACYEIQWMLRGQIRSCRSRH